MEIQPPVKTVIFYAPLGNLTKGFRSGGAEAGCRKTIEVLKKASYNIILIEKPARRSASNFDGVVLFYRLFKIWLKLIYYFSVNRNSVFHVAGFYRNQIYMEWFLLKTARIMGIKTIYEVRNGGMTEDYYSGTGTYKYFMRSVLINTSLVLCQGYTYVVFLKDIFNKKSVLYPNYIMDDFITGNDTNRQDDKKIKLIYFGRVVANKNVEFIIDICKEIKALNFDVSLDIIGSYEASYHQVLMEKITKNKLVNDVVIHGRKDFTEIYRFLKTSHFFIFPSREEREGHSNSLTEAMGCGVIPIVSTAGFNVSITGYSELVIPDFFPEKYACKVAEIWGSGDWKLYSDKVYNRICENYTEKIVSKTLLKAYEELFSRS